MRNFFAILGGMGTLATESFVRLVNENTHAHNDQEFLDYIVFNHASVPDRTAFIEGNSTENPVLVLKEDIHQAAHMGASFIVLTCNTAHYFFDELQETTDVPLLHMPRLAVEELTEDFEKPSEIRVGFLGTDGSIRAGIYEHEIKSRGFEFVLPTASLQKNVMSLIYDDVKGTGDLNESRYRNVLTTMIEELNCDVLLLGCTELSVLNEAFPHALQTIDAASHRAATRIVDAQEVLVRRTVEKAKSLQ